MYVRRLRVPQWHSQVIRMTIEKSDASVLDTLFDLLRASVARIMPADGVDVSADQEWQCRTSNLGMGGNPIKHVTVCS